LSKKIIVFTILILVANSYILSGHSLNAVRVARVGTALAYFTLFLSFDKFRDKFVLLFFLTLIFADVFNVFYENPICRKLTSLFKLAGYLLLINKIIGKVKLIKSNTILKVVFIAVLSLNIITVVYIINSVSGKTNDVLELVLLLIYGLVLITLCSVAANYNFRYNNKRSKYFLYLSFGLVFTDISAFAGYFLEYSYFFYGTRLFYMGALLFVVYYAIYSKEEDDILIEDESIEIKI